MMGIMTDDFNLFLKKNSAILNEVINDLSKVQKSGSVLISNLNSSDLKFVNSKFNLEINQLNNAIKKLNGYQNTLKSVYLGYQKQFEQVVIDSKKLIS